MSDTTDIILRTAAGLGCVIGAGFGVTWLIGGLVGTRVGRSRDRREPTREVGGREFLLGDHPTYVNPDAGHNLDDTDGLFDDDEPMTTADVDAMWDNVLDGKPLPDPAALRDAEIADLNQPETGRALTWVTLDEIHVEDDKSMRNERLRREVLGMWAKPTGDPNAEVTEPQSHADLDRIRAFAPPSVRARCQIGMCCVDPTRLADRCVHGAYGNAPLGCPQIEGGDYRLSAESNPVPRLTGLTRDEARDRADLARLSPWATSGPDDLGLNVTPPPVLDETIPTSPRDTARPGMGQIIPTQRKPINGSAL